MTQPATARSVVCSNSGGNVIPGGYFEFKTLAPPPSHCYCPDCGRRPMARIVGTRGHYELQFNEHPRRGVTRGQWRVYVQQKATIGRDRA